MLAETVAIRQAVEDDLDTIIAMFADDALGGHGDTTEPEARADYLAAFRRIAASANETLYVAVLDGEVVGTFQAMLTTAMPGRGGTSMIIEAVQTRADRRGLGIGAAMIAHAVAQARVRGVRQVQLTSNATRKDAHRFYERLGFSASHIGFKLKLK
ncbi:GNAT family N-acetyltransferase [Peteryoungia desertarenae]|uniref:GNAT family N-acetyltransferase n=1 Tax=Peteryoungia desertarenae TaxID=1813451 RepID=A0ABX6QNT4_9HYPH|nr:GNAT family N-acetyltransferase [Peteryoungia desertarenae]QLF70154.1 GNAT family N-acetyltransferase [Peteryoungia desertarenae]